MQPYSEEYSFMEKLGNNLLSWDERRSAKNTNPSLTIPSLRIGTLDDVKIGKRVVFEEFEDGKLHSCTGLEHLVRIPSNTYQGIWDITIFDNHNHALFFWIEALTSGVVEKNATLVHIDEHSDLWENNHTLDLDSVTRNTMKAWEFANFSCNVGNYIVPAIKSGLINNMIRIENEYQIDENRDIFLPKNSILNIDLDFFAEELDHIDRAKKISLIRQLLPQVHIVTVATSPYFIEWERALEALREIFETLPDTAKPTEN